MRMLLSFQRPPSLFQRASSEKTDPTRRPRALYGPTNEYSAQPERALTPSKAPEATLADLQHLSLRPLARDVVLAGGELGLAEAHAALVDQPARLRAGDPELLGHHRGQVHATAVAVERRVLDLLGHAALHVHAIEVAFRRGCVLGGIEPRHELARQRPLGVHGQELGGLIRPGAPTPSGARTRRRLPRPRAGAGRPCVEQQA